MMKKIIATTILIAVLLFLFLLSLLKFSTESLFLTASLIAILLYILLVVGPHTIKEISLGKLTIKRNVERSEKILAELQSIKRDVTEISKLDMENTYILASESMLAAGADKPVADRLERNLGRLEKLNKYDEFDSEMSKLFEFRKNQ